MKHPVTFSPLLVCSVAFLYLPLTFDCYQTTLQLLWIRAVIITYIGGCVPPNICYNNSHQCRVEMCQCLTDYQWKC